jgi:hypothetical protein
MSTFANFEVRIRTKWLKKRKKFFYKLVLELNLHPSTKLLKSLYPTDVYTCISTRIPIRGGRGGALPSSEGSPASREGEMKVRLGEANPRPEKERGTTSTSSLGSGYSPIRTSLFVAPFNVHMKIETISIRTGTR